MKKIENKVVELQKNDKVTDFTKNANEVKTETQENNQVEELIKENERLKTLVSAKQEPENFEEKIKYFKRKQELIKRREKMEFSITNLNTVFTEISNETNEDIFLSENYSIKVVKKPNYGSEQELVKLRNPVIIAELVEFLITKADNKLQQIEADINA